MAAPSAAALSMAPPMAASPLAAPPWLPSEVSSALQRARKEAHAGLRAAAERQLLEQELLFARFFDEAVRLVALTPAAPAPPDANAGDTQTDLVTAPAQQDTHAGGEQAGHEEMSLETEANVGQQGLGKKDKHLSRSATELYVADTDDAGILAHKMPYFNRFIHKLKNACVLVEPERTGNLARFVSSPQFESFAMGIIVLNTCFIVIATVYRSIHVGDNLAEPEFMATIESAFLLYFSAEVLMKLFVHRMYFFCNANYKWNLFDFCIVSQAAGDVLLSNGPFQVTFLRSMRVLRLSRLLRGLRVLRALRSLDELRTLLDGIVGCFLSLFWSGVVVAMILMFFSLVFVQATTNHLKIRDSYDIGADEELFVAFGTLDVAFISLLHSTTGGDWHVYYKMLQVVGPIIAMTFLFFFIFFNVAIWNIVTSIFIEKAIIAAYSDTEKIALSKRDQDKKDVARFSELLGKADQNSDGKVHKDEFISIYMNPQVRAHFEIAGLNISDPNKFWDMIADTLACDEIDVLTLAKAFMRLEGPSTRAGLYTLKYDMKRVMGEVEKLVEGQLELHVNHAQFKNECRSLLSEIGTRVGVVSPFSL